MCFTANLPLRTGRYALSLFSFHSLRKATPKARFSPELKKRMQGKACFNFTTIGPALFRELAALTRARFEGYRALKYI